MRLSKSAVYLAVLPTLSAAEHAVTHMIATQLLAAADLGERVEVRAQLERRTRHLAFLSATATVDERLIGDSLSPTAKPSTLPSALARTPVAIITAFASRTPADVDRIKCSKCGTNSMTSSSGRAGVG